jgi:hypothetical protein
MIAFPFLGRVKSSSLSAAEVERKLTTLLADGYLKRPQVSVSVKEFGSQKVFVTGEFQRPGPYSLKADRSLLTLLGTVGDVTPNAGHEVVVIRPQAPGDGPGAAAGLRRAPSPSRPPIRTGEGAAPCSWGNPECKVFCHCGSRSGIRRHPPEAGTPSICRRRHRSTSWGMLPVRVPTARRGHGLPGPARQVAARPLFEASESSEPRTGRRGNCPRRRLTWKPEDTSRCLSDF